MNNSDNTLFEQVEQTQHSEQVELVEQTQHNEPPVVMVLSQDDKTKLDLANGYHAEWIRIYNEKDDVSLNSDWGSCPLGRVPASVVAWALLASVDYAHKKLPTDPSQEPILVAVSRSVYLALARRVIKVDGTDFLKYPQRVTRRRDEFDHRVHVGMTELNTPLNVCSIWSLVKRLDEQVRSCVNRCYEKRYHDLPIISDVKETSSANSKGSKTKTPVPSENEKYETPRSRTPEDSLWDKRANADLALALYDISKTYNQMLLQESPDFSQAYRSHGVLLREQKAKRYEDRKAQYQNMRSDRDKKSQNDVRPSGPQTQVKTHPAVIQIKSKPYVWPKPPQPVAHVEMQTATEAEGPDASNAPSQRAANNSTNKTTNNANRRVQVKRETFGNPGDNTEFKNVKSRGGPNKQTPLMNKEQFAQSKTRFKVQGQNQGQNQSQGQSQNQQQGY
jgi:hypothetical protein